VTRAAASLERLLGIMVRLRDPAEGCPWDRVQTFASIAPHTLEEAYEVADAIARDDLVALRDELGDLLFQVVYHARMAEELGAFDFASVAEGIGEKLERRHPHVFGGETVADAQAQGVRWDEIKAAERHAKRQGAEAPSVLDELPLALPALSRAAKIGKRVARVGFDWPDPSGAFAKVNEEVAELQAEAGARDAAAAGRRFEELGDLLFAVCNVARKLDLDPEAALRHANAKFERRFRAVEAELGRRGKSPAGSDLAEMDAVWEAVKTAESGPRGR
jgi:tetrapyrrole methylase family protein/MazG family protein/ATP diphosphatase